MPTLIGIVSIITTLIIPVLWSESKQAEAVTVQKAKNVLNTNRSIELNTEMS